MSSYRVAIDWTTSVIDRRATNFRNLIITVTLLSLGSIIWASATRTISALCFLLLLFPVCGFFLFFDHKLLGVWLAKILTAWVTQEIDLHSFYSAINVVPKLPNETLDGMLSCLPKATNLVSEQRISASTREAIASTVKCVLGVRESKLALRALASAIVSGAVIWATIIKRWQGLYVVLALLVLPGVQYCSAQRRVRKFNEDMRLAKRQSDFSETDYRQLLASLRVDPAFSSQLETLVPIHDESPRRDWTSRGALP